MRREHESLDGGITRGGVPVVDRHGTDERGAGNDGHVLGLAPVRMPGPHESRPMVADGVKALDAGEIELVHERQLATIVDRDVAGIEDGFAHEAVGGGC